MIRDSIKRLNTVVKELLLGILIFGAAIWMIFIWFISDKWGFSQGLLLGVAASALLAIHMNYSIEQSLERTETDAKSYMQKMSVLRMGMVLVLFGVAYLLRLGSPIAVFAGLFTLKFGAYFQPVPHRLIHKKEAKER